MAEEKKETTKKEPKKTTKKVEKIEEVKVEKRFCTNCGKELLNNEECDCQVQVATSSVNQNSASADAFVRVCKTIWDTMIGMFTKPIQTIKESVAKKDPAVTFIILGALVIISALGLTLSARQLVVSFTNLSNEYVADFIDIPYLSIFIYSILIYALMMFIPILAAFVVAKITGNKEFKFMSAFALYATSMSPQILAGLGMLILTFVPVISVIASIAVAILSMYCFFNFIVGFINTNKIREDRQAYALTGLVGSWLVCAIIAIVIFIFAVLLGLINSQVNDNIWHNNSNNSSFYW